MASGGGRLGGRDDGVRGRVMQGRYSKMRGGRLSANRWELLDDEEEQVGGDKGEATGERDGTPRGNSGAREMEVEGVGDREGTPRVNSVAREMEVEGVGGN